MRTFDQQQLILEVADAIEENAEFYSQSKWFNAFNECGTTCCIAGWAVRIAMPDEFFKRVDRAIALGPDKYEYEEVAEQDDEWFHEIGMALFGLSDYESNLFNYDWMPPEGMTVPDALRKFAGGDELKDITEPNCLMRKYTN